MLYVTINGTSVYTTGLTIENVISSTPDTCSFELHDPTSAPIAGQEVVVYRDTTANTLFRGLITGIQKKSLGKYIDGSLRKFMYTVNCEDYQYALDDWLVSETFTSQTCESIISDIVANFVDPSYGFTTTHVATGRTITQAVFNYMKPTECIDQLAKIMDYEWYVDTDKDIHFFEKETVTAPFDLTEDRLHCAAGINNFNISPDYSNVKNRCYVRGGYYLSDNYTETFVADGERRSWPLSWKPHSLSITVNAAAKTVAVDNLYADDGTYEYFFNYGEKYVRCADNSGTTPTPSAGDVIAVTYKYEIPVIVRCDNNAAQAALGALLGSDGIKEMIVRDETIQSREEARDRGNAEIKTRANADIKGSFTTFEHGFAAGQFIGIDLDGYESYDGNYQIKRVTISPVGPNEVFYRIEFATTLFELKDLLAAILRQQARVKINEDEKVDILNVIDETITVTDAVSTSMTAHPKKWGTFKWGLGTWSG